MALYYDAASVLSSDQISGSFKSRIYSNGALKSKPAQIYALISETAKRDAFLKEVLENAHLLEDEPKLTPLLATLLSHDHFFSRSGIAAPAKHPLRQAIERHKARLQAEFTRARLKKRCGSVEALKKALDTEKGAQVKVHPRWVRVNTIKPGNLGNFTSRLQACKEQSSLAQVIEQSGSISYRPDNNVPHLYAFTPSIDLTSQVAYKNGEIILQDKASCFPAHLLLGDQAPETIGDMIDGCAAPGNKTTHLAAIAHKMSVKGRIFACERDPVRSKTLQTMVSKAGAHQVEVLARQDFLALDPEDVRFAKVTHLLLDPSCSGSGILGREDVPKLALPNDPRAQVAVAKNGTNVAQLTSTNKKRKRNGEVEKTTSVSQSVIASTEVNVDVNLEANEETPVNSNEMTKNRLIKLSNLQTRIVEHAMSFPAATRITYSTCSIHELENEIVVSRVLRSNAARTGGWRILRRDEQVSGMREWRGRGVKSDATSTTATFEEDGTREEDGEQANGLDEMELEACIRCSPDDGEGTMGFFVCGFVKDLSEGGAPKNSTKSMSESKEMVVQSAEDEEDKEEEWGGFD